MISSTEATNAGVGDVIFYQNNTDKTKNKWTTNGGHASILASVPKLREDGKLEITEYTINAESETEGGAKTKFGQRTVVFIQKDGNWVMESNNNYQLMGFGRIDEKGIKKKAKEDKKKAKADKKNKQS